MCAAGRVRPVRRPILKVSCRPRPASIEFQATCQPDTLRSCIVKKFFEGISLSSIVAGTLAAVTSFLLASKIGIGGSVIGAAASYVVSAVATKIYQNVLTASMRLPDLITAYREAFQKANVLENAYWKN